MTRKLLLHIGFHKTGSTSIQRFLAESEIALAEHGWSFARSGPPDRPDRGHYRGLVRLHRDPTDDHIQAKFRLQRFVEIAERHTSGDGTRGDVIISSELLSWVSDPEELRALAEVLRSSFDEITILAFIRRQDSLAVSHSQQVVKPRRNGLLSPAHVLYEPSLTPLPPLAPRTRNYLDFAKTLRAWGAAFGEHRVETLTYAPASDVIVPVASKLGLAFEPDSVRENVGLDARRDLFNRVLAVAESPAWINRLAFDFDIEPIGGSLLPTPSEARSFLEQFSSGNRWLEGIGATFAPGLENKESVSVERCLPTALDAVDRFIAETSEGPHAHGLEHELDRVAETARRLRSGAVSP